MSDRKDQLQIRPADPPTPAPILGAPAWVTEADVADTIRDWSPYYGKTLTRGEAVAILRAWDVLDDAVQKLDGGSHV